jgi:methionine--tRNA ligase beta chain
VGVAKADSVVDVGLLEFHLREDLNRRCKRVMGVLRPLKLTITNFPGEARELEAPLHPEDAAQGSRKIPFSSTLYIEREDYRDDPPKDWFRLGPGREVRLRYACLVTCNEVVRDAKGEPVELKCTMDLNSWGGNAPDGRAVRGTLHWVSAPYAIDAEVRLYDRLFSVENPGTDEKKSFLDEINPNSLERVTAKLEPYLQGAPAGERYQFERLGYFCVDPDGGYNRTVTLKDTWAKLEKKQAAPAPKKSEAKPEKKAEKKVPETKEEKAPPGECTIDDLGKIDLRVGLVKEASLVEGADKLIKLQIDLGEGRLRQIFAGLRASYPDPAVLVGQRVVVIANLKPRQMKFGLSEGMVLAAGSKALSADASAKPGDRVS